VYKDDTWEWDGAAWREITTQSAPFARENGAFEFDPGRNELVLFGGYAGRFHSDVWVLEGNTWTPRSQGPPQRRRAGR
jgi:murein tripeptide amidase MpaA